MSLIFCTMIYTWELLTKLSCWFSWLTVAVSYQLQDPSQNIRVPSL